MNRPFRISARLLALMLVVCAACSERPRPGTPPRHMLLLTVEGLRADHVTSYGYIRQSTHVRKESAELVLDIDRMALTGVAFHNAYAPASVVAPSVASLLTGARPDEHGVFERGAPLRAEVSTLAEAFAAQGFATAAFVGADSPLLAGGLARGFGTSGEFATDTEMLQTALAWLTEQAPKEEGFFLWVHFGELREPLASEPMQDMYSGVSPALDRYDGGVARANLLLHMFLENYRFGFLEHELFEQSLIAICGTNGVGFRGGGTSSEDSAHSEDSGSSPEETQLVVDDSLTEDSLRVPLIFCHPGSLTGRRIFTEVVTLADVAPTLRDWFGLGEVSAGSGRNLLAITDSYIEREFTQRPAHAWSSQGGKLVAQSLRDERWRATFGPSGAQLFDMHRDPEARFDVATDHPELLDAWRAQLTTEEQQ